MTTTQSEHQPSDHDTGCDPRKARSRAKVIAAAADIMVESGPRAVTVDAVSDRSGVAKSTIYRHWDSRAAIVVDVIRTHMPTIVVPDTDDFEHALRSCLAQLADAMNDPQWARILPAFVSLQVSMPEVAELNRVDRERKSAVFAAVFALGIAEGRFGPEIDEQLVAPLMIGPMMMATISGSASLVPRLAIEIGDQFLAAHPPRPR